MTHKRVMAMVVMLLLTSASLVFADGMWQPNGEVICNAANYQETVRSVSDLSNGAIIVWRDYRSGTHYELFGQRVDGNGNVLWTNNGVKLVGNYTYSVNIASDDSGGAFITWCETYGFPNYFDVKFKRIDGNGSAVWYKSICSANYDQTNSQVIAAGNDDAIIVWRDKRNGTDGDIYAQRVNQLGNIAWSIDGIPICENTIKQESPRMVSDAYGGAIIAWIENDRAVYGQKIDMDGNSLWANNGAPIASGMVNQIDSLQLISDGNGGAIAIWEGCESGMGLDIYGQRIDGNGNTLWSNSIGIDITNAAGNQVYADLLIDGSGNIFITWRNVSDSRIYCQQLDSSGNKLWANEGVLVDYLGGNSYKPQISSDGVNGVVIIWQNDYARICSQRIDSNGNTLWSEGVTICEIAMHISSTKTNIKDGLGGSIISWDGNFGSDDDIYAQKIIRPWPKITAINPAQYLQGEIADNVTIFGDFFWDDKGIVTYVKLTKSSQPDIAGTDLNIIDRYNLTCDFNLTSAALGNWNVVGYDSLGQTSTSIGVLLNITTPTPTFSSTPTNTPTPTNTLTITVSPTSTPTPTNTPTITVSSTSTSTPIHTNTSTATESPTSTPPHTNTPTNTVSPTLTITVTLISTSIPTTAESATVTTTPTKTPTATESATYTATPTITRTATESPTATVTPTITLTPTISPTSTITPTITITSTITPTLYVELPDKKILAYPNPAKGTVRFAWQEMDVEKVRIEIYNMSGERIATLQQIGPGNTISWAVTNIAPGIYLYQVILTKAGKEMKQEIKKVAITK